MKHKLLTVMLMLMLVLSAFAFAACDEQEVSGAMDIAFGDGFIKVDGEKHDLSKLYGGEYATMEIGRNNEERILLSLKNEQHDEVKPYLADVKNLVVTVVAGGEYRFSGTASDTQIAVDAPAAEVKLILDGLNLQCATAAAIQIYNAADPRTAAEYGVTIELAEGSNNSLWGSHTAKTELDNVKHDGAISSNVSLGFSGSGRLELGGDKEGIEVKYGHLTFDGGVFEIISMDDPIGASEDGVAVITVNDGLIHARVDALGEEGDGIDSNGYIVINGGTVVAVACPHSMDSGLDADMGISINGGTVMALGNMYDAVSAGSLQRFASLQLAEHTGMWLVLMAGDTALMAAEVPAEYSYVILSSPQLVDGEYQLFDAASVSGLEFAGLTTEISSVVPEVQLGWNGDFGKMQPFGGMPGGDMPAEVSGKQPGSLLGIGNLNGIEITADGAVSIAREAAEKLIQIFEGLTMTVDLTVEEIMQIDTLEKLEGFFNDVTTGLYLPQSWVDANLLPPGMRPQGWQDVAGTNEPVPGTMPPVVDLLPDFMIETEQNSFGNVQPLPPVEDVPAGDTGTVPTPPGTQIK